MGRYRWDLDNRKATLLTRLYVLGMRLARDKQAFDGEKQTLATAWKRQSSRNRRPNVITRGLHVHEVSAMFHVWMTRLVPEGRRTRQQLVRLVRQEQALLTHQLG